MTQVGGITSKSRDPKQSANRNRCSPGTEIEKKATEEQGVESWEVPEIHKRKGPESLCITEEGGKGPEAGGKKGRGEES